MLKLFNTFIALERINDIPKGIKIPMSVKDEKPKMGKVIAIDTTCKEIKDISIGNHLLFVEYAPFVMDIDGKEIIFVKNEDVIAIISNS